MASIASRPSTSPTAGRRDRRGAGGFRADRVIDARGLVVCPGLIDLSARLREPGFEYKATLESEMQAAVAGRRDELACPPDTDPPLDEPGLVQMLKHRARSLNQAHVYPIGALTVGLEGVELTEMGELAEAGCVAFSQAEAPLSIPQVLLRAMQYAATFGHRVWLRPQDAASRQRRRRARRRGGDAPRPAGDSAGGGNDRARVDPRARPQHRRARAPLPPLDGRRRRDGARREGGGAAGDVRRRRPSSASVRRRHRLVRSAVPPDPAAARHARPRALRAGLADGTIDLVCSDHTPVDDDGKQVPFGEAEPGATGLELLLPLTLKWARGEGRAARSARADHQRAGRRARRRRGTPRRGQPRRRLHLRSRRLLVVGARTLRSQGRNTPFLGLEVPAGPLHAGRRSGRA